MLDAPQSPAWWFIGGDAVHKATEDCDLDGITSEEDARTYWDTIWQTSIAKLYDDGVDLNTVKAGGRKTNEWPNKENQQWWEANGPDMVVNWVKWRESKLDEGWVFYEGAGLNGIEVPVEFELGDVLVKGYIDRVFANDAGEVIVVDLKSGSRQPDSSLQLGVYSAGFRSVWGVTPSLGAYYMTRKGTITEPVSLLHYTDEVLGKWFSSAKRGIENEVFIPHVTGFCNSCSVAQYCVAVGGNPAPLANPANV